MKEAIQLILTIVLGIIGLLILLDVTDIKALALYYVIGGALSVLLMAAVGVVAVMKEKG